MSSSFFYFWICAVAAGVNLRHARDSDVGSWQRNQPETFKLELSNYKGVQYTAPITIGKQTFMAVYDTGSFDVMVVSHLCTACSIAADFNTYDSASSTSFRKGKSPVAEHHFAGGLVVARQDYETVHVGRADSVFKVEDMAFWQVVKTDMPIWKNKKAVFTAIVGLGHRGVVPSSSGDPSDPAWLSLIERTGTQRFAICLKRGPKEPGYLVFNPTYDFSLAGPANGFRRISVVGERHWAVTMNSVSSVQGAKTQQKCIGDQACVAIIDSGTSLIGVPPHAVSIIYDIFQQVNGDCSNLDALPDLVFELDGQKFTMPGSAYTVQFGPKGGKPTRCVPAFMDFDMTSDRGAVWILGMPFLRHFYTVFDRQEPSIYVADQGDNCEPAAAQNATGANSTLFNTSGLVSGMRQRRHEQPAIVDLSEARLPEWAQGRTHMTL